MGKILGSLFGSPKTTLGGLLGAVGTYLATQPGGWMILGQVLNGLAFVILGSAAKDATTTGAAGAAKG